MKTNKKQKKSKSQELGVKHHKTERKIVQMTQSQIPIKDIANGTIIVKRADNDYSFVKIVEVFPVPFINMKITQQNIIRQQFENMFKTAPAKFQIFSLAIPANLDKQIQTLEKRSKNEKNEECLKLIADYKNSLEYAQKYGINRKFYIAFSDDSENISTKNSDEIDSHIYKLNQFANRVALSMESCGNQAKVLNNNEIAKLLYLMLNRNERNISFEERYEQVYDHYLDHYRNDNFYIPPTDYLAPKEINYMDNNCVLVDGRYYTYLYITSNGYPERAVCGLLDTLVSNREGVDVHIFFEKKDKRKFKEKLRQTVSHSKSDLGMNANEVSDSYFNATSKLYSAEYLYSSIMNGQEIYDASVIISISGNSIKEINEKKQSLIDEAKNDDMILRDLKYQTEQAFLSTLPLNNLHPSIKKKAKRNMPQSTAAILYPFTTYEMMHDNGVMIANTIDGNSPVIPNFWDNTVFVNQHCFMVGTSGAGKTSSALLFLIHLRLNNIPVYCLIPEKQMGFVRVCDAIGGQFVDLGLGSPDRINIMGILENDKNAEETNDVIYAQNVRKKASHLEKRVGIVAEFIRIHYPQMSMYERQALNDALIETYAKKGITIDNNSLWADEEHTHYKEMPILSDLVKVLETKGEKAENLYMAVKYLTTGACSFLDGQTNVDVNNKFFVVGLENNTDETRQLACFVAEDFIQYKIRENKLEHSAFYVDEAWAMLQDAKIGSGVCARKLKEDAKLLREFGALLLVSTQQLADSLSTDEGAAIVKNCATKIIMKHNDEDIKYLIGAEIELSSAEIKKIKMFSAGEALFLSDTNRMSIKFCPSELEKLLVFNDEKTLKTYIEYMKNKKLSAEELAKRDEYLKNAISLDELLQDPRKQYISIKTAQESLEEHNRIQEGENYD